MERIRQYKKILIPVVIISYLIVVCIVFGKALFPSKDEMIFGDDIHHAYYFCRQYFNYWLRQGTIPWWNSYNFAGAPFIANPMTNIFYLPTWLFVIFPLPLAYSIHIALHITIAMTGMYIFARLFLSPACSWFAGLIYGLSGFFMARVFAGHVDIIASASLAPWVMRAFWEIFEVQKTDNYKCSILKKVALAGFALCMQIFAGYLSIAMFTLEAIFIAFVIQQLRRRSLVEIAGMFGAVFLGVCMAGVQLIPMAELLSLSIRSYKLPYSWASYGSHTLENLKQLISPFVLGDAYTYKGPPPNYSEHSAYIGTAGLGLALFGAMLLFHKNKRTFYPVIFSVLICVFGMWVSFGKNAFLDLQEILWTAVPLYRSLRIPSRHLFLFVFGASILAGFGLETLKERLKRFKSGIMLAIVCFSLIELIFYAKNFIEVREIPELGHDKSLIKELTKDKELYRFLPNFGAWLQQRESIDFPSTMVYGIFSASGYDPTILKSYYNFINAINGNKYTGIIENDIQVPYMSRYGYGADFLNIKYILVPFAYDQIQYDKSGHFALVQEDVYRKYRLYENKKAAPRFFMVYDAISFKSYNELATAIIENRIDLRKNAGIVDSENIININSKECPEEDYGDIDIISYTPNRIRLSVSTKCSGLLSSSEVFYPGWSVYIDGKKDRIIKTNMAFRGVFVSEGDHRVTFEYFPKIFIYGGAVSFAGFFLCGILLFFARKPGLIARG